MKLTEQIRATFAGADEAAIPAAINAVTVIRAATLVGVRWGSTFRGPRQVVIPYFTLAVRAGSVSVKNEYALGGREGILERPWCAAISVFVHEHPVVLAPEIHRALCALAEPQLSKLHHQINEALAQSLPLLGPSLIS